MSTVQELFQQAQLAEASYADFSIQGISTKDALIAKMKSKSKGPGSRFR